VKECLVRMCPSINYVLLLRIKVLHIFLIVCFNFQIGNRLLYRIVFTLKKFGFLSLCGHRIYL